MNRARDEFLPRSGFALNGDARFTCGDALHLREHALHHRPRPNHLVLAEAAAQVAIFVFQMTQPQNIFRRDQKFFCR